METNLKCQYPIRIRNQYTGEWMYVNCRECPACMINKVNSYCVHLKEELKKYPYQMMVTLTYDNNHLPFMVENNKAIYRGIFDSFPTKVGYLDYDLDKFETIPPNGFPDGRFTGVLFYDDIQKFLKRLRIYYERKFKMQFPWRNHSLGEYGTIGKRPHFHLLFFGFEEFDADFRTAVIECWSLSTWSRLNLEESFKFASEGVTSYLTSYVNSFANCNGFLLTNGIQSKVRRSKNKDFGVKNEISKAFQKSVECGFSSRIYKNDGYPFRFWDTSKLDNFSIRLLPKKYISSVFQVPAGLHKSTFDNFSANVISSLRKSPSCWENSDYLTNLSYKKYAKIKKREIGEFSLMLDYVLDAWNFRNYYQSQVIGLSMKDYEKMTKKEYYTTRYNTLVDNPNVRELRLLFRNVRLVDDVHTGKQMDALDKYVDNYKYKLLPKHLKELVNGFHF